MLKTFMIHRLSYVKKGVISPRQKRQCQGGGIMVWGMTMSNGLIAVKILEGKQDSEKYIRLFKDFAVPIINLNNHEGYHVIQDNCPIHVSKKFQLYSETQTFQVLKWPARSPDLNIMENVWKMISDILYDDCQPKSKHELVHRLHNAVLEINSHKRSIIIDLYRNFRYRLPKVLICKGNIIN